MSISILLVIIALVFAVLAVVFPNYPLLAVAVILLSIVILIGNRLNIP